MSRKTGENYEDYACTLLEKSGLRLLYRNFCCRYGEIDLIMQEQKILVFVEVKYRSNSRFGSSLEMVTWQKKQKILVTAAFFLRTHSNYQQQNIRFDVVGLEKSKHNGEITHEWIKAAFDSSL